MPDIPKSNVNQKLLMPAKEKPPLITKFQNQAIQTLASQDPNYVPPITGKSLMGNFKREVVQTLNSQNQTGQKLLPPGSIANFNQNINETVAGIGNNSPNQPKNTALLSGQIVQVPQIPTTESQTQIPNNTESLAVSNGENPSQIAGNAVAERLREIRLQLEGQKSEREIEKTKNEGRLDLKEMGKNIMKNIGGFMSGISQRLTKMEIRKNMEKIHTYLKSLKEEVSQKSETHDFESKETKVGQRVSNIGKVPQELKQEVNKNPSLVKNPQTQQPQLNPQILQNPNQKLLNPALSPAYNDFSKFEINPNNAVLVDPNLPNTLQNIPNSQVENQNLRTEEIAQIPQNKEEIIKIESLEKALELTKQPEFQEKIIANEEGITNSEDGVLKIQKENPDVLGQCLPLNNLINRIKLYKNQENQTTQKPSQRLEEAKRQLVDLTNFENFSNREKGIINYFAPNLLAKLGELEQQNIQQEKNQEIINQTAKLGENALKKASEPKFDTKIQGYQVDKQAKNEVIEKMKLNGFELKLTNEDSSFIYNPEKVLVINERSDLENVDVEKNPKLTVNSEIQKGVGNNRSLEPNKNRNEPALQITPANVGTPPENPQIEPTTELQVALPDPNSDPNLEITETGGIKNLS